MTAKVLDARWLTLRQELQDRYAEVSRLPDASRLAYLRGPAHTVTEEMIADLWREAAANPPPGGPTANNLYIHVPFCKSLCSFCNYERLRPSAPNQLRAYLDRLKRSMEILGPSVEGLCWGSVYVGGGTPSTLPGAMLDELFTALSMHFDIHPRAEKSFELDPAVISNRRLDVLKEHGFSHFSFGIQSLMAEVNQAHNRGPQGRDTIAKCFNALYERELYDVACDFLLGLDGTTPEGTLSDISWVLENFAPQWIDVFQIAPTTDYVEKHFGGDLDRYWEHLAPFQKVVSSSFRKIARPLRYRVATGGDHRYTLNRTYVPEGRTTIPPKRPHGYNQLVSEARRPMHLLGLGPSARSQIFGHAAFQCRDPGETPLDPGPAVYEGHKINFDDEIRTYLVHRLRDGDSVNRGEFSRIFGVDVEDAVPVATSAWLSQGLATSTDAQYALAGQSRRDRTLSLMWLVPDACLEHEIARRERLDTSAAGVEWLGQALEVGKRLAGNHSFAGVWEGRVIILTPNRERMVFRLAPGLKNGAALRLILESRPPSTEAERQDLARAMRQVRGVLRQAQADKALGSRD